MSLAERWNHYVDFWSETEAPDAYALGRIVWGVAMVGNVLTQVFGPGVMTLYGLPEDGGIWEYGGGSPWTLFRWLEPTPEVIWSLVTLNLLAALSLTVGLFTRTSALVLMVVNIALISRLGLASFGGDSVVRVFSFLMVLAPLGASWSLDARLFGRRDVVPKWPRRLIQAQLTFLYVKTGIVKAGSQWSFSGGHSAVYYAMNDPSFARFDGSWAARIYPLTQLGTFVTRWWETLFFLLPWNMFLRRPGPPGRLRRTLGRFDLRPWFLSIGVILHLSLFATMQLGMFPWVTMSIYLFFLHPREARRVLEATIGRLDPRAG